MHTTPNYEASNVGGSWIVAFGTTSAQSDWWFYTTLQLF